MPDIVINVFLERLAPVAGVGVGDAFEFLGREH